MTPVAIITRERSGSTVFRRFMASHPDFANIGEIWNFEQKDNDFYDYWVARVADDPWMIRPQNRDQVFLDFIDKKTAETKRRPVFDQKYGHINLTEPYFVPRFTDDGTALAPYPSVFKALATRKAHIIHLVRRNKLRLLISTEMAKRTGVWHLRGEDPSYEDKKAPLELNPEHSYAYVEWQEHMCAFADQMLARYQPFLRIAYEDLFDETFTRVRADMIERLARFLGAAPGGFEPVLPLKKTNTQSVAESVANMDALRERFAGTPHAWMLDS